MSGLSGRMFSSGCGDLLLHSLPSKLNGKSHYYTGESVESVLSQFVDKVGSAVCNSSRTLPFLEEEGSFDEADKKDIGRFLYAVFSERSSHPMVAEVLEAFGFECIRSVYNGAHPKKENGKIRFYFLDTSIYSSLNPSRLPIPTASEVKSKLGLN